MVRLILALVVVLSSLSYADEPKGAAKDASTFDMGKAGPWARKPSDEKKTKKDLEAFFKEEEAVAQKGDQEAMLARIDFPVYMVTDDLKGNAQAKQYTKEQYVATMKPFYENMPKDVKYTHKPSFVVLSDSLANVVDDFTMTTGKTKLAGRNQGLLVKIDGAWKWKVMTEAGWGGMGESASR